MSIMDQVKKNLREWYALAADRTGDMAKMSVRMYDKYGISREIERQLSEMGSYVFHAVEEGRTDFASDSDFRAHYERVKGLERDLQAKVEEIEEIRAQREERQAARAAAAAAAAEDAATMAPDEPAEMAMAGDAEPPTAAPEVAPEPETEPEATVVEGPIITPPPAGEEPPAEPRRFAEEAEDGDIAEFEPEAGDGPEDHPSRP